MNDVREPMDAALTIQRDWGGRISMMNQWERRMVMRDERNRVPQDVTFEVSFFKWVTDEE